MRAVRDDEVAARLAGIHVARTQVLAFVVSAACAGLGGGLLAVLAQSVSPGAFSLTLSLYLLLAIVVGGLGSLAGAVWGALLLVILPDLTQLITEQFTLHPAPHSARRQPAAGAVRLRPDRRHDRRARRASSVRWSRRTARWPTAAYRPRAGKTRWTRLTAPSRQVRTEERSCTTMQRIARRGLAIAACLTLLARGRGLQR